MKTLRFDYKNKQLFEQAKKIRTEVFVIGQNCPVNEEFDEFDEISTHYLIYYGDSSAATSRWRETNEGIKLERFAVLDKFRGKGLAKYLVETMLKDTRLINKQIYLYSQIHAAGLYKKFGFIVEGNSFDEVGIKHYKMVLKKS